MLAKKQHNPDVLDRGQRKVKRNIKATVKDYLSTQMSAAVDWVRPEETGDLALNVSAAQALAERVSLSNLMHYTDIDANGLMLSDDGNQIRLGFMVEYAPFSLAGTDVEGQIESVITLSDRPGTVYQFGVLSSPEVMSFLNVWEEARIRKADSEMIGEMVKSRSNFFRGAAYSGKTETGEKYGYSLVPDKRVHPKKHNYYLTVMVPFNGALDDEYQWDQFVSEITKLRSGVCSTLDGAQVRNAALDRTAVRHVLRCILNPQHVPEKLRMDDEEYINSIDPKVPYSSIANLVDKDHRLAVKNDGTLLFEGSSEPEDPRRTRMVSLTVDRFPVQTYLPLTSKLMGDLAKSSEAINKPFWLYTNIVTQDSDGAQDRMTMKMARVTRQLVSDSPAYQAFMSHLFEMRDQLRDMAQEARRGKMLVGAYMGINVLTDADSAQEDAQAVASIWSNHGFKAKPEKFISLPVYLCSVPGHFRPEMDPLNNRSGLQRIMTMTSFQAATLSHMQGEWRGCNPANGGIPLISRRGELAALDIQDKGNTNYNFTVIADSGAGKSFFAQDIVLDFLSKGGLAFIIDAGRSYFEFVEQMGGTNLVFKVSEPLDLNPFAEVRKEQDLKEMMELLKETIRYMAWPTSGDKLVPDWQYTILEHAIEATWQKTRENTTVLDVAAWLANHEERDAQKIAEQLRPYTHGRLADWFNGNGKKVNLRGKLICLEMDDLKTQGAFRDVALTIMMQRIADAMYHGGDTSVPKVLLIDEAWDLLSSNQAGPFINRAYRTYRKYGGSAGIITQKFSDLEMSEAAKAAYANSAWLLMLKQKPESLVTAFEKRYLKDDEYTKRLAESVHTIPGKYSEVLVKSDMGMGVYRFVVDPYTYWLYTTDKDDKAARAREFDLVSKESPNLSRTACMAEALKRLANSRFRGMYATTPEEQIARIKRAVEL
jgi:conjugal transfer ATP-binding protein TraC